ncbi:uncharacterized protein FOMMEDRAFT_133855 [Fomitiporia mediterranea MF3/22]|uniref:uncharacterized protein n=1 Tax=Fomitiporia mediterranea (strain MF3/22) TaxID=694068 RepID=UPI0004407FFA|nr:uncharacterized protein FOMMEDRAFT_133855 [Fomitiporia mediterranea MF3/22]EJD02556.1 hypothetical protein FOMMEDRAFT_133855 [Fomitiporia mediterranea MF3/22]
MPTNVRARPMQWFKQQTIRRYYFPAFPVTPQLHVIAMIFTSPRPPLDIPKKDILSYMFGMLFIRGHRILCHS